MRTTRNVAAIGLVVAIVGCEVIAGIHEGKPFPGECENQPEGKPVALQTPGDCVEVVCNGAGSTKEVLDPTDILDDRDPCTLDECNGSTPTNTPPTTTCHVLAADAGAAFTCALLSGGVVKCWGNNAYGQLALGDQIHRDGQPYTWAPVNLGTGTTATAVGVGGYHACALFDDGTLKCWGRNTWGELGLGDTNHRGDDPGEMASALPTVNLGTGKTATGIGVGADHTCALLNDGSVKCWGVNFNGELGLGDTNHRGGGPNEMGDNLPTVDLGTGKTAIAISAGLTHTCALLNDGSVKCWGGNFSGELGLGDMISRGPGPNQMGDNLPAVDLGTGKTAIAISVAEGDLGEQVHTCALLNDGNVKCWGINNYGQLGLGDLDYRGNGPNQMGDNLPPVNLAGTATAVTSGGSHSCALLSDNSVKCWGANNFGQLGLGDIKTRGDGPNEMGGNLPIIKLGSEQDVIAISAGTYHGCAVLNNGSLKCWGYNESGGLGLGDTNNRGDGPGEMGDALPAVKLFSDVW